MARGLRTGRKAGERDRAIEDRERERESERPNAAMHEMGAQREDWGPEERKATRRTRSWLLNKRDNG